MTQLFTLDVATTGPAGIPIAIWGVIALAVAGIAGLAIIMIRKRKK